MHDASPGEADDPFANSPYRPIERLGAGGMGEVYLVEHRHLRSTFVAKIMRAELAQHPQVADRMRLEAQTLGQLNHPNIVTVTGFGTGVDGRPFLVMEHLHGRTLREELELRGSLPLEESAHYLRELLTGLGAAHALGIVHRDIKPDNLFLASLDSGARVLKILDFGIARVLPGAPSEAPRPLALPTATGEVIGTPRFLSPEGAVGVRVDTRADLYGAVLVFYAMITGHGPFDHIVNRTDLMEAHAREAPAPPSAVVAIPLPAGLDELVLRALAKDPTERFQTTLELADALARVVPPTEPPPSGWDTTRVGPALPSPAAVPLGARSATERLAPSTPRRDPSSPPVAAPVPTPRRVSSSPVARPASVPPLLESVGAARSRWLLVGIFLLGVVISATIATMLVGLLAGAR